LEKATYSNIAHLAIEAVTDSIRPWVVRIEAWVNADPDLLPPRNFVEFELEGLLRGDTASRYEAYSKATGRPWMSPNEVRRLENAPRIDDPEMDRVASPLNMGTTQTPPVKEGANASEAA
jgi:phage portal protein BeeE